MNITCPSYCSFFSIRSSMLFWFGNLKYQAKPCLSLVLSKATSAHILTPSLNSCRTTGWGLGLHSVLSASYLFQGFITKTLHLLCQTLTSFFFSQVQDSPFFQLSLVLIKAKIVIATKRHLEIKPHILKCPWEETLDWGGVL